MYRIFCRGKSNIFSVELLKAVGGSDKADFPLNFRNWQHGWEDIYPPTLLPRRRVS